eukprot:1574828-Amphidinium_carterae.1
MSLEGHNLAEIMNETKNMKTAIVDENNIVIVILTTCYINADLDKKMRKRSEREIERITREHTRDVTGPILRSNALLAQRRRDEGVDT